MWSLLGIFIILIGITVWSLVEKDTPTLVKPIMKEPSTMQPWKRQLIAFGDSLTAGYQLPPEDSFPAQLQKIFDQEQIDIHVINAGKSGDTSSQMRERMERSLADAVTGDILFLTAGANDGLQWLPLDQLEKNILAIVDFAQQRGLLVVLWWMQLPPNYGEGYTQDFAAIYPRVAEQKQLLLFPFLLEWVASITDLNLADGIHPNATWYAIIAKNIFWFLQEHINF